MRNVILILVVVAVMTGTVCGEELKDLLTKAVSAEGEEYRTIRNEIIQKGQSIVPELMKIQEDKAVDWKTQLMSGICRERIERADDIEQMEKKDWASDPEFDRQWLRYRPGPWIGMESLVVKRYREKKLWFYCLEAMWKGLDAFPRIWQADKTDWEGACQLAVEESPMRDTAIRLLEDRVDNDPMFKNKLSRGAFIHLIDLKSRRSLPVLLKAWKAQGGLHPEYVAKLSKMLTEDDINTTEEFLKNTDNAIKDNSAASLQKYVDHLKRIRDAKKQKDTPDKKGE